MAAPYQNYSGGTFASDLITVPNFTSYLMQEVYERSAFVKSGIIARNSALDASSGGVRTTVPGFIPVSPFEERMESNATWGDSGKGYLTPRRIQANAGIATLIHRGLSFAADELSKQASGADPMAAIMGYMASVIDKNRTATLLSQLGGLFGTALAGNAVDVSAGTGGAEYISASAVIRCKSVLGERGEDLSVIALHPNVYYQLEAAGMLVFSTATFNTGGSINWSGGGVNVTDTKVATFAGLRVIMDSQLPVTGTGANAVYTSYLFGPGVVNEGVQQALETRSDYNILSWQDVVSMRYSYGFHVMGSSWIAPEDNPGNIELAEAGKYGLVWDRKLIPLVKLSVFKCHGRLVLREKTRVRSSKLAPSPNATLIED